MIGFIHNLSREKKIALAAVSLTLLFVGLARLLTQEDTWICEDGVWVAHGAPSVPQPTGSCE